MVRDSFRSNVYFRARRPDETQTLSSALRNAIYLDGVLRYIRHIFRLPD